MRNSASVFTITAVLTVGMSAAAFAQSGGSYGAPGYQGYQGGPYGNGPMAQGGPLYRSGPGYQGYQGQGYQGQGYQGPGPQGYGPQQGPARQYGGGPFGYDPQFGNQGGPQQGPARQYGGGQFGNQGGPQQGQWGNQAANQSRSSQRVNLRQQLRQAGFQSIRILDTTYLVQARTPSGNEVLMVVNPAGDSLQAMGSGPSRSSQANQRPGNPDGRRFGSNEGASSGNDQNAQAQTGQNQANASNQNRSGQNQGVSGQDRSLMSEDQVASVLASRGFSDVSDLKRDNNIYTGTADWYGEQVDLKIDARNGFIIDPSHMTEDQMGRMLEDDGWSNIENVQLDGTAYQVDASQNGTPYHLWIDARTGEITRQTASNDSSGSPRNPGQGSGTTGTVAPNASGSSSSDADGDGDDSGG